MLLPQMGPILGVIYGMIGKIHLFRTYQAMPTNAGIGVFEAFSSLLGKSGENTNTSERSERHCLICSTPT